MTDQESRSSSTLTSQAETGGKVTPHPRIYGSTIEKIEVCAVLAKVLEEALNDLCNGSYSAEMCELANALPEIGKVRRRLEAYENATST